MSDLNYIQNRTLAAYFFNIEYYDDPNVEIDQLEMERRYNEADIFNRAVQDLIGRLSATDYTEETDVMSIFYDVGKQYFGIEKIELFRFFNLLYMTVWGRPAGPRFGVFALMYGIHEFGELIHERFENSKNWLGV